MSFINTEIDLLETNSQVVVQTPLGPVYVYLEPDGSLTVDYCPDQAAPSLLVGKAARINLDGLSIWDGDGVFA